MINVKLIKVSENKIYDITQACETVTWSGATLEASRTAEITYLNAPYDSNINVPQIATGDFMTLEESGKELFFGQFYGIERASDTGTITYTANDMMKHLLESNGQYNFKNISAEEITRRVCADVQVDVGALAETGISIRSMICNGTSFYDIILGAYTQAYKATGKKYHAVVKDRKLCVVEANTIISNFILSDKLNITKSDITETMDSIKNRIWIYDDKGNRTGEVKDDESIRMFGVFQDIYEQEEGTDPQAAAKNMLSVNPTQELKLEAIGDMNCLSGYGVAVEDGATGMKGLYWIKDDKHTFSGGTHTMELTLSFDKLMDEKDIETEDENKE